MTLYASYTQTGRGVQHLDTDLNIWLETDYSDLFSLKKNHADICPSISRTNCYFFQLELLLKNALHH